MRIPRSKVFTKGGPFVDMYNFNSKEAKNDKRLQSSGDLKHFKFLIKYSNLNPKLLFMIGFI